MMKSIGLLSDTHNFIHPKIYEFFYNCDEIWHAGDIGGISICEELNNFKPLKAVYGNMDGNDVRVVYPKNQRFMCEELDVWMTHIGGYPNNYSTDVKPEIRKNPPKLFISGHSHILKVIYDKQLSLLHINPGAAGRQGAHKKITLVRFKVECSNIKQLEIMELER